MFQVFSLIAWSSLIERVWSNLFWMGGRSGNRELPFPSSFQDFNASHIALLDNLKLIIIRLRLCLFKIQLSGTALAHMINKDNIEDIFSIYFNLSFGELLCFNISVGKGIFSPVRTEEENLYQWFPILSQLSKKNNHSIILQKIISQFQIVPGELQISRKFHWNCAFGGKYISSFRKWFDLKNIYQWSIVEPWVGWNILYGEQFAPDKIWFSSFNTPPPRIQLG